VAVSDELSDHTRCHPEHSEDLSCSLKGPRCARDDTVSLRRSNGFCDRRRSLIAAAFGAGVVAGGARAQGKTGSTVYPSRCHLRGAVRGQERGFFKDEGYEFN